MSVLSEVIGSPFPHSTRIRAFKTSGRITWDIEFIFNGPDGRYNPAYAHVSEKDLPRLLAILKEARKRCVALAGQSFSGSYNENLGPIPGGLSFEIEARLDRIGLLIWISNNTRWRFSRRIKFGDLEKAIAILESLPARGQGMVESLATILKEDIQEERDIEVKPGSLAANSLDSAVKTSMPHSKIDSNSQPSLEQESSAIPAAISLADWRTAYEKIRESRASARCRQNAILFGVCSGLLAQAIHSKLTRTTEVRVKPRKYLAIIRLKVILFSLLCGVGVIAYFIIAAREPLFDSYDDFDDSVILTEEEKEVARLNGWEV